MPELSTATRQENITRAAVGAKERPGADARTAEHRTRVADRMKHDVEAAGPRAVFERAREVRIDPAAAQDHIDSSIGTRDEKTGNMVRTGSETARRTQVRNAEQVTRNIIQKDISDWSPAERAAIGNSAKEALASIPEAKQLLDELAGDPLMMDKFITDSLAQLGEDGDLKIAFAKRYKEVFSGERPVSQKTAEAQAKVDAAKTKIDTIDASAKANTAAIAETDAKLAEFAIGVPPGAKALELTSEEAKVTAFLAGIGKTPAQIDAMRATVDLNELKLRNLRDKMQVSMAKPIGGAFNGAAKQAEMAGIQTQIDTISTLQEEAAAVLPQYDAVSARRDALSEEAANLHSEKIRLDQVGGKLGSEKTIAQDEYDALKKEFDAAKLKDTDGYVKDAQSIMKDALKGLYEQRMQAAITADEQELQNMIDAEMNPHAKKVLEQVRNGRWRTISESKLSKIPGLRGGKNLGNGEVEKFNTTQIREDLDMLRAAARNGSPEEGPRVIVNNMLERQGITDPAERQRILDSNEFKTKVLPKATERLLAAAMKNGMLSVGDAEIIDAALPGARQRAIDTHKDWLEAQKKASGFVGSTVDYIKKHPRVGWWLLLSAFYPPAGLLVGAAFAFKNTAFPGKSEAGHATHPSAVTPPEHESNDVHAPLPDNAATDHQAAA